MATPVTSSAVLSVYRQLLRQASCIDDVTRRATTVQRVRDGFAARRHVRDAADVERGLADARSRLSFLRASTSLRPRSGFRGDASAATTMATATTRLVVRDDGTLVDGAARARDTQWFRDQRIDPDDWARHQRLLRRQHFIHD